MGKIHIPEDLKNKLDRVLGIKMQDANQNINVGPAPSWTGNKQEKSQPPPPPPPPPLPIVNKVKEVIEEDDFMTAVTSIKPKKKKPKKRMETKLDSVLMIFGGSVVIGFGLTLGFKLGKIIFY